MKVILEKKSKIYFHFDDPSRTTVKTLSIDSIIIKNFEKILILLPTLIFYLKFQMHRLFLKNIDFSTNNVSWGNKNTNSVPVGKRLIIENTNRKIQIFLKKENFEEFFKKA